VPAGRGMQILTSRCLFPSLSETDVIPTFLMGRACGCMLYPTDASAELASTGGVYY